MKKFFKKLFRRLVPQRKYLVEMEINFYRQRIAQKIAIYAPTRLQAKTKAVKRSKFATSTSIKSIKRLKDSNTKTGSSINLKTKTKHEK
jgi:hypothetical protein